MGQFTAWKYIKDQYTKLPLVSADLAGKTVVVVGANGGLGLGAAKHLATMNPGRLILACRNMEKAEGAVKAVRDATGCETLEPWCIDLSDFKSVCAFADRYAQDGGGRLDLLIMNAGINSYTYRKTVDGWEEVLQVDHLSFSLLTLLLLPYLKTTPLSNPTPRIVIVTSEVHYLLPSMPEAHYPQILERLNDEKYSTRAVMGYRYFVAKLLNVFFTRSLASRLPKPSSETPSLTVTSVNPGWCKTQLQRDIKWTVAGFFMRLVEPLMGRSIEMGSRTLVWAALAGKDAGGEVHGRYTTSCRVDEESDYVISPDGEKMEERLWQETLAVLRNIDPRVDTIVAEHLDHA
ncbi:short-chain dehydrogenase [Ramaria rubella]|nr:short-chain dehydrogenase [Ramaria rubella]